MPVAPPAPPSPLPPYQKKPLTTDELLYRLLQRNLLIDNRQEAENLMEYAGYFRLLIYMRKFQGTGGNFRYLTKFSHIGALYRFDQLLRELTMSAIERIEVGLRATMSNALAMKHGPHWFFDSRNFEDPIVHHEVLDQIIKATSNRKNIALRHYFENYSDPKLPPVWLSLERLTFGALSKMFSNLSLANRKLVAEKWSIKSINMEEYLLVSWFRSAVDLRNVCAHHSRIWDGKITTNLPRQSPNFPGDFSGMTSHYYNRACVLLLLLGVLGHGQWWKTSLAKLLSDCDHVDPVTDLGFKGTWKTSKLWGLQWMPVR